MPACSWHVHGDAMNAHGVGFCTAERTAGKGWQLMTINGDNLE